MYQKSGGGRGEPEWHLTEREVDELARKIMPKLVEIFYEELGKRLLNHLFWDVVTVASGIGFWELLKTWGTK